MAPAEMGGSESVGRGGGGDKRWHCGHKCKILFGKSKKTSRAEEETQRVGWIKILK